MILYRILFSSFILINIFSIKGSELRWDWNIIEPTAVSFNDDFVWGVAISEYQVSGAYHCKYSNWAFWEKNYAQHTSDNACDHWSTMDETIACAKSLGIKAFRFSVDWSMIEPTEGFWREEVLEQYRIFCEKLLAVDIQPMMTLHHFAHPQWFEKLGAFEKAKNIKYFVRFAEKVFNKLHDLVNFWCTINEPGIYVFQAYVRGVYPPGKRNIILAGAVLENLCKAHVRVYKKLKESPGGAEAQIGIVHNIIQFEPYDHKSTFEKMICSYLNMIVVDAVFNFFAQGKFNYKISFLVNRSYNCPDAQKSLDFIGLNYYSHVLWSWKNPGGESYRPGAIKTDMPYAFYPEGFYRAIKKISTLNVPIYITENGIPDKSDTLRDLWIKHYTYAMHKAIEEGCDVRGFFYWSLMDNFEWDLGFTQKFGLYEVDFNNKEKKLRPGAQYFIELIKKTYKKSRYWYER